MKEERRRKIENSLGKCNSRRGNNYLQCEREITRKK